MTQNSSSTVFVSYSHVDREYLDRLSIHLRPLEKRGVVDLWNDTKIGGGDLWSSGIEQALARARVGILLITADFLASDFIVDNELPPLLEKAEKEGTRIIPLILKPCRFTRDENLRHFQAINDPSRPLVTLPMAEQEAVYDRLGELVERLMRG